MRTGVVAMGLACSLPGVAMTTGAQQLDAARRSPLASCCALPSLAERTIRFDTLPGLAREGTNPAGVAWSVTSARGLVAVRASDDRGPLHRPQAPRAVSDLQVIAEGRRAGTTQWASGAFSYTRRAARGVEWANVAEPYEAAPYVWADSVGGDWQRDFVTLRGGAGRSHGRLHAGVSLEYGIGQGARQNDPRPLFRRRVAEVTPGLAWTLRPGTTLGVTARRAWTREDGEVGGGLANTYPILFRLRGMSTFDRTQLISAERALLGGAWGVGGALEHQQGRWRWVTAGEWRQASDSARDGISRPVTGGATRRVQVSGRGAARYTGNDGGVEVRAEGMHESARGRDPVFDAINTDDVAWRGLLSAEQWSGSRSAARQEGRVVVGLWQLAREDIASETTWQVRSMMGALEGGRRHGLGTNQMLHLAAGVEGYLPLVTRYADGVPTVLTGVLAGRDMDLMQRRRVGGSLSAALEFRRGEGQRLRVELAARLLRAARGGNVVVDDAAATQPTRRALTLEWTIY